MARKLLIVDDIGVNREILKKILGGEYEILEAENGVAALRVMRREYDTLSAVLLDLSMPEMDGFEALEIMRADARLSTIPVIVTTGQTDQESEVKALALGANDYIAKPYVSMIIKQRIKNTINLRETAATVNALRRDRLTGLFNREAFFDKVAELAAASEPGRYVMAAFDIDSFKVINDQYGAGRGDETLVHVARSIAGFVEPHGGLCCRVMADHFAVFYPASLIPTGLIEENHRHATSPPCIDHPINIRVGRYIVTDTALSASAMYDRATMAEESIRGRYDIYVAQYDESMRERLLRMQGIVNEMKGALADGQFEVWYQPQFNHATGALIGAEGLVRWRHPARGLIPPAEFIPVFESNGFIYELDKYVWERVCISLREWLGSGREPLPVSVNISRYDLFRDDLVDVIKGLAARYGIPAGLLRLEITESAFASSAEIVIRTVERLKKEGFIVEIDDFGSGYSSLNTLKDVPADVLKLDMNFLKSGVNSNRGGNIVESVVRMAKWLGMPVIAEGVETINQADYLKSIGCNYMQGYLYARPMPKDEYERFTLDFDAESGMLALETVENLDSNALWDPDSLQTLIFNSYVGGACIFEYSGGDTELLRINDNFISELGGLSSPEIHAQKLCEYLDGGSRAAFMNTVALAVETGAEQSCELLFENLGGSGSRAYIRAAMKVIERVGSRYMLYCTIFNITALREAQRKELDAYEQLETVMRDMPGGFCRVRLGDDGTARFVYMNDGFCALVGSSRDELMRLHGPDSERGFNAGDTRYIFKALERMTEAGGELQTQRLVVRADGREMWAMVVSRMTETQSGERYINAYYTEIEPPGGAQQ